MDENKIKLSLDLNSSENGSLYQNDKNRVLGLN